MSILSMDIVRLIHHYLLKEGYKETANVFISECMLLKDLQSAKSSCVKPPRLLGPSLVDLLESYFQTKDLVVEELELLKPIVFKEQDSLTTLTQILIGGLKSLEKSPSNSSCADGSSVNTAERSENLKKNGQKSYEPSTGVDFDPVNLKSQCRVTLSDNQKEKADFCVLDSETSENLSLGSAVDFDSLMKAVVLETQPDPSYFDSFIKDCIAKDCIDQSFVGLLDSTVLSDIELSWSASFCNLENNSNIEDIANLSAERTHPASIVRTSPLTNLTDVGEIKNDISRVYARSSDGKTPTAMTRPQPMKILALPATTINICRVSTSGKPPLNQGTVDLVGFELNEEVGKSSQGIGLIDAKGNSKSIPEHSKPKPVMKIWNRPLRNSSRKKLFPYNKVFLKSVGSSATPRSECQPLEDPLQITPAMTKLIKLAQDACKSLDITQAKIGDNFLPPQHVQTKIPVSN